MLKSLSRISSSSSSKNPISNNDQVHILKKYVIFVYYEKVDSPIDIDIQRMRDFEYSTYNNLRLLPPSKLGLIEHIKRAANAAGWVEYQCVENVSLPNPIGWGWGRTNGKYSPTWQVTTQTIDTEDVTTICSCSKEKCNKCRFTSKKLACIPFCKCHRRCLYKQVLMKNYLATTISYDSTSSSPDKEIKSRNRLGTPP